MKILAKKVAQLLVRRGVTLAVAESCTGGAIANILTDIPGASRFLDCSVVVYSNSSKQHLLGVRNATLEKYGAVSEAVAKEMAQAVRRKNRVTHGLSVTGIAGPAGGSKKKPVGTVYIGLATAKKTEIKHFRFECGRLEFKRRVTAAALNRLRRALL